jgi:hypothetical protein
VGSKAIIFAGCLATPLEWLGFEGKWQRVLDDVGIDMFHMNKFANRQPPFDGWSEEKLAECLGRLLDIMEQHVGLTVGVALPSHAYDSIFSDTARRLRGPYATVATFLILDVAEALKTMKGDHWIRYIIESGTQGAGEILTLYQENTRYPEDKAWTRIKGLSFENKRCYLPLQAADIVAYEIYRHFVRDPMTAASRPIDDPDATRLALRRLATISRRWFTPYEDSMRSMNKAVEARAFLGPKWRPSRRRN